MSAEYEHYLDYLEKEMHIMGVLSTFCLAVPSLILGRIVSLDTNSIAYDYFFSLLQTCSPLLIGASAFMLVAATFFYFQRSYLAFNYGQIALEMALPNYTRIDVAKRLKNADAWVSWIPYHQAKGAIIYGAIGYFFAFVLAFWPCLAWLCWVIIIVQFVLYCSLCKRIDFHSKKYRHCDSIKIKHIG
jgi:hypothetical protein